MSDQPFVMSSATDPSITVGDTIYPVRKFVTAKFIRAMTIVTKLIDEGQIATLFAGNSNVATLLSQIPELLLKGEPYLLKFCALTLTPNAKLRQLEESEESVDAYLDTFAKSLAYHEEYSVDKVIETVTVGIEQMGVQAIRKNVQRLQSLFQTT